MTFSEFIGVDLGTSILRKSTGLVCLVENRGRPMINYPAIHIKSDDELIRSSIMGMSSNPGSTLIAIDAPLSLPDHGTMRECEKRLRKHKIACYASGAKWVRQWVDKGIGLKNWAENELGAGVIEVYPYAARRSLDLGAHVKKKTKQGRQIVQEGLLDLVVGLNELIEDRLLSDDELDAVLSAYTAYCVETGNAGTMDGLDGTIYFPIKKRNHMINEYRPENQIPL